MKNEILLIDYENIREIPVIEENSIFKIIIIVGQDQHNLPLNSVQQMLNYGKKVELIKVNGRGKNALDFVIAFYLGQYVARNPGKRFRIHTKDKGFDPLINHLQEIGIDISRTQL